MMSRATKTDAVSVQASDTGGDLDAIYTCKCCTL